MVSINNLIREETNGNHICNVRMSWNDDSFIYCSHIAVYLKQLYKVRHFECHKILHELSTHMQVDKFKSDNSSPAEISKKNPETTFVFMSHHTIIVVSLSHQYPGSPFSS